MPDQMQNEAMQRLKQMYSRASVDTPPTRQDKTTVQSTPQAQSPDITEKPVHNENKNMLDILMQDKEKSLIILLVVILMSEKADTSLLLGLMYLIL